MTLEDAVTLLEISDLQSLEESDLKLIRNRAKRRWHFDKIAHTNPSESEIKRYNDNTYKIDIAVDVIKSYLQGNINLGSSSNNERVDEKEPIDIIRENAARMQDVLSKKWNDIKNKSYKKNIETVFVSEGISIKEALRIDLEDQVFVKCVLSLIGSTITMLLIALLSSLFSKILGEAIFYILMALNWICLIAMLPLARIWLPKFLYIIVYSVVDFGIYNFNFYNNFFMILSSTWRHKKTGISSLFWILLNIPVFLSKVISFVLIYPVYFVAGEIFKNKKIFKVEGQVNYYAGLAEWYIDNLLSKNIKDMTEDEFFSLSHAYNELTTV